MIPLRFIAESIGQQVNWDQQQQAVIIGARPSMPVLAPYGDPTMEMPCTLRVAIRGMGKGEPLTSGPYTVQEVELADYVANVLAHEFGDFTEDKVAHEVPPEALKAGAVAVMMYGWYYSWHPTRSDYDLDNSTNAQVYMSGRATERYREAVRAVWGTIMVRNDSEEVFPPQHGQGHYNASGKARTGCRSEAPHTWRARATRGRRSWVTTTRIASSFGIPIRAPGYDNPKDSGRPH